MSKLQRIGLGLVFALVLAVPPAEACDRWLPCPELWEFDSSICGCVCASCECRAFYGECYFGSPCCDECWAPSCFNWQSSTSAEPAAPACSTEAAPALALDAALAGAI